MVLMLLCWMMLILGDSYLMMGSQDQNENNLVQAVHYLLNKISLLYERLLLNDVKLNLS